MGYRLADFSPMKNRERQPPPIGSKHLARGKKRRKHPFSTRSTLPQLTAVERLFLLA